MQELIARIERLEAIEDIKQLKARYARLCDAGPDADGLAELFTETAVMDQGPRWGVHDGREAIRRHFAAAAETTDFSMHHVGLDSIEVAADLRTASGRWYLWQPCTFEVAGAPTPIWLSGHYQDEYVREADGWRFSSVTFHTVLFTSFEAAWPPYVLGE